MVPDILIVQPPDIPPSLLFAKSVPTSPSFGIPPQNAFITGLFVNCRQDYWDFLYRRSVLEIIHFPIGPVILGVYQVFANIDDKKGPLLVRCGLLGQPLPKQD